MSFRNQQRDIVPGSIYDAPIAATDAKFLQGRVPYLGQRVRFDDGREFVFCSTNADLVAGEVVAFATAQATEIAGGITAAAAGTNQLTIATTGVAFFGGSAGVLAANRLAGGYIALTDDTGEGYIYRIKSHTAGTAAVAMTFTLWDNLKVAVDGTTDCVIVGPKYRAVVEGSASLAPVGVAVVPTTASTDAEEQFFWVQCKGPAACLGAATVGVEVATAASGAVANAAEAGSGGYDCIIGTGLGTTANGYAVVDLRL
jgi:hypothetical protein